MKKKSVLFFVLILAMLFSSTAFAPLNYDRLPSQALLARVNGAAANMPLSQLLDDYLTQKGSPLAGQGSVFVDSGQKYDVDPRLIVAIAGAETSFGTRLGCYSSPGVIVSNPYNAWNWFYKGGCPSPFNSWADGIDSVTQGIGGGLYFKAGRTTIEKIAEIYTATDRAAWIKNVTTFYHDDLGGDLNDLTFKSADLPGGSQPPPSSTNTFTTLIFDTSGSMADPDASGVVKLAAAKDAGTKLLDVIGAESQAGATSNQVAIVNFSNDAVVDIQPTQDIAAAEQALGSLQVTGATAMSKGLKAALDLFPSTSSSKSFIILLTDGLPNIGLNNESDEATARQQVLDLASQAGQRGICVFTVGLGDPASGTIDEDFLKQVAQNSVCGSYHNAKNSWELANTYIGLRHSIGTTLLSQSGLINQGQLLDVGNVQIPGNQSVILFTLNWPGSFLDAILKDPNGLLVDSTYPGASITNTGTLASIIIQNPLAGQWSVSVRGVNVPEGTTNYNALLSIRPNPYFPTSIPIQTAPLPSSSGFPLVIAIVVLAGAGVVVYTIVLSGRRSRNQPRMFAAVPGSLIGLSGTYAGRSIPLGDGMQIGRSSLSNLRLSDPSISRRHAQIRFAGGRWYIQDLKSQSGVYVNGVRIQAAPLNPGDRIRIGFTEFEYR